MRQDRSAATRKIRGRLPVIQKDVDDEEEDDNDDDEEEEEDARLHDCFGTISAAARSVCLCVIFAFYAALTVFC